MRNSRPPRGPRWEAAWALGLFLSLAGASPGQAAPDPPLIGTVLIEGGPSFALFGSGSDFWQVREGEDIGNGAVLKEIQADRVVVESEGVSRPVYPAARSGSEPRGPAPPARTPAARTGPPPPAAPASPPAVAAPAPEGGPAPAETEAVPSATETVPAPTPDQTVRPDEPRRDAGPGVRTFRSRSRGARRGVPEVEENE